MIAAPVSSDPPESMRVLAHAALVLLCTLLTASCTTFFDTDAAVFFPTDSGGDSGAVDTGSDDATGPDVGQDAGDDVGDGAGACCFGGGCQEDTLAVGCEALNGTHFPGESCASAGCTPSCGSYCTTFLDACSEFSDEFVDRPDCVTFCSERADWERGQFEDESINTVGCRLYHADIASREDPDVHCQHSGITGGNVCGSWCANYCDLADEVCEGRSRLFPDIEACLTACSAMPANGRIGDESGDTIQCRIERLVRAANNSVLSGIECDNAAPDSDVCN